MLALIVVALIVWAFIRYDRGSVADPAYVRRPYWQFHRGYDGSLVAFILIVVLIFVLSGHAWDSY